MKNKLQTALHDAICTRYGHWFTKPSQDDPEQTEAINESREKTFGDARFWHSHCRWCGERRTVSITARRPGARERKVTAKEKQS